MKNTATLILFRREDHKAFHLHPCLRNAETEAEHLRLITETFISELLPSSFSTNSFVRNLLREIFTCKGMMHHWRKTKFFITLMYFVIRRV